MKDLITPNMDIRAVLFDFGGVIADEGFKHGLQAIAQLNGLDPTTFIGLTRSLIYSSGYINGQTSEAEFWQRLRELSGISQSDAELREAILCRFTLRPHMLATVDRLRARGLTVAILSDQTNWLDELNARDDFFKHFDMVFNSFYLGTNKSDAEIFVSVRNGLFVYPQQILFIDDYAGNTDRARAKGLNTILYTDRADFETQIAALLA
ncbi:MAG: Alpha-D-glucose-1-phosphate phosphatase YihX [Deltaproteobacteria bacterium ADurb.Bin510]|nr:MAG: Alpha-D-glucose-1-phosphate phosphatase YihX [Deltaproteobacteria bacterium ADurb.Bin510]